MIQQLHCSSLIHKFLNKQHHTSQPPITTRLTTRRVKRPLPNFQYIECSVLKAIMYNKDAYIDNMYLLRIGYSGYSSKFIFLVVKHQNKALFNLLLKNNNNQHAGSLNLEQCGPSSHKPLPTSSPSISSQQCHRRRHPDG